MRTGPRPPSGALTSLRLMREVAVRQPPQDFEEPDPPELMRPYPPELMRTWAISTRVNKPENDDGSPRRATVCSPSAKEKAPTRTGAVARCDGEWGDGEAAQRTGGKHPARWIVPLR